MDFNLTTLPLFGSISSTVHKLEILIGGVFGIYLIILYLRWKEYRTLQTLLMDIRNDIRELAEHQGVALAPIKRSKMKTIGDRLKEKLRQKPEG
jgi:hypothetical protein